MAQYLDYQGLTTLVDKIKDVTGTPDSEKTLQDEIDVLESGKADKASITAGTAGTSSATSGSTLAVPYVTMNAQGVVTGYGTHTHTITGFNNYSHPTGDGNLHVPATSTTNNGKFLMAGSTAGSLSWGTPANTVTTATTSGTGNAVTAITASNGALTVTKGATFLTSHQDISGKQDKDTAVTHTSATSVGGATTPVYVTSAGVATACTPYASATVLSATNASIASSTTGSVNGFTISASVPSGAKFTDTVTTVSTSGSGNAITAITASNGAITATKGTTFLTSHQDISGKANLASPAFTGTPTAPTATKNTSTTQLATTQFVVDEIADKISVADAMIYKGTISATTAGVYTPSADKGWTYKVATAGLVNGVNVEVGDMLICNTDSTVAGTSSNSSTVKANWDIIQANIDGAVTGPASATSGTVAIFNNANGKVITGTSFTISSSVPANAKFTDTVTTVSVTGSGNAITTMSASNGAITATKGTTFLTSHQDISGKQDKSTAVTHTASTSVGASTTPVYITTAGVATACTPYESATVLSATNASVATSCSGSVNGFTISASVPSGAKFTDTNTVTTVSVTGDGNAITSMSATNGAITATKGATFLTSHQDISGKANAVTNTSGTAGTSTATSGSSLAVPYVTVNAQGVVTGYGTHTHTITGFNNYSHPTGDGNLHVPATSTTNNGKFLMAGSTAGSLSWGTPTNTITAIASTTGSGNAVTAITASNGQLTVTKGTTFLTSHQDISGKANAVTNTSGTAGVSTATSGSSLSVPYVTVNAQGVVTGYGTHTHTVTGFATSNTVTAIASTTGSGNAVTAITASGGQLTVTKGTTFLTSHQDISGKQDKSTAVTHTASTSVGGATTPVYITTAGVATACTPYASATVAIAGSCTGSVNGFTVSKSVPASAVFTDTDVRNTAGTTNTTSKIFLVGATSQATSATTYSDANVYTTNGTLRTTKLNVADKVTLQWNATTESLDFVFA